MSPIQMVWRYGIRNVVVSLLDIRRLRYTLKMSPKCGFLDFGCRSTYVRPRFLYFVSLLESFSMFRVKRYSRDRFRYFSHSWSPKLWSQHISQCFLHLWIVDLFFINSWLEVIIFPHPSLFMESRFSVVCGIDFLHFWGILLFFLFLFHICMATRTKWQKLLL